MVRHGTSDAERPKIDYLSFRCLLPSEMRTRSSSANGIDKCYDYESESSKVYQIPRQPARSSQSPLSLPRCQDRRNDYNAGCTSRNERE
jgi:hypothetical protein